MNAKQSSFSETASVYGLTTDEYNKLRGQAGRGGQSFSAVWAEEMRRVAEGGLMGGSLAAIATRQDAEIANLKAELVAWNARIGCLSCACVDDCEAEPPVCQWFLSEGSRQ